MPTVSNQFVVATVVLHLYVGMMKEVKEQIEASNVIDRYQEGTTSMREYTSSFFKFK